MGIAEANVNKKNPFSLYLDDQSRVFQNDTPLSAIDFEAVESQVANDSKRKSYIKWTDKNRYDIGKYSAEYGTAAAIRKFRKNFPKIKESTAREFRKKYEEELREAKKEGREPSKSLQKYQSQTGRPLLLGDFDSMVQSYIVSMSNRGAVISRSIANSAAKALMKKHPGIIGNIDVDSSSWAQSLFRRMGYSRRRHTSAKVDIPEAARKEIEYLFLYEIVSKVEKYEIPESLIINFDQTPLKLVPCGKSTLAKKNSNCVTISGASDKRSITGTFSITLDGSFLPMQLIYGGKTEKSLPRFCFPDSFSLSVNKKHFSNRIEAAKFLEEIIVPFVKLEREAKGLSADQKALVIMDVFTGQMTPEVLQLLQENNILVTNVPANMTKFYQPLDLSVNGYAKRFLAKKFNEWYSSEITKQLDEGASLEEVNVKLRLSVLKPLHAGWLIDFYNQMTSEEGKKVIHSGWRAAGIRDALRLGLNQLPSLDPFIDIDPMLEEMNVEPNLPSVSNLSDEQRAIAYSREEMEEESEWEDEEAERVEKDAFSIFKDFDDEDE